jgi:hypothetical protein
MAMLHFAREQAGRFKSTLNARSVVRQLSRQILFNRMVQESYYALFRVTNKVAELVLVGLGSQGVKLST